jgi:hypothetical protein
VQPRQRVALALLGHVVGRQQDVPCRRSGQPRQRLLHPLVGELCERVAHAVVTGLGQRSLDIPLVSGQLARQQLVHVGAVFGTQPAALNEQVCQRGILAPCPFGAGADEAVVVDQLGLQRQHAEEKIAVGIHERSSCCETEKGRE